MFTREQASLIKQEFWTAFGKYMSPIPSAEGMKVNWVNYHTRVKDVLFRMDAAAKSASISILIQHKDLEMQQLYYEQFQELRNVLHFTLQEEWQWQRLVKDNSGKIVSRIYKELSGVSVLNRDDWPQVISFFKQRIMALDSFWENARYSFEF
jgi:hypothetical protein